MSTKAKGTRGERDLIKMFWGAGWAAIRSAGSGSQTFPSPDLLAGNKTRVIAIEAKVTKDKKKYFSPEDVRQLVVFAQYFGAEAWIAIKFSGQEWKFFTPEDLDRTAGGYVATADGFKGLCFDELAGN